MAKEEILRPEQKVKGMRQSFADCSIVPTSEEALFLRQSDYWALRYHGRTALLRSTRGLHCLAVLLSHPGQEFHVRQLLNRSTDPSVRASIIDVPGPIVGGLYAGIPLLDAQAKSEYKRRLNELRQDVNKAEQFNDLQRKTEALNEVQAITDCLASAVGLGGRDRRASSDAERARSSVTKCIKKAIQKIGSAIPSLGYHLGARIKTGYFCSYKPHPERPINWKF